MDFMLLLFTVVHLLKCKADSCVKGAQIIVATPGRLIDLMKRGVAKLDAVCNVVLDEADEMLNMGSQKVLMLYSREYHQTATHCCFLQQ